MMNRIMAYLYELFTPLDKIRNKSLIEKIDFLLKVNIVPYNVNFITESNYFIENSIAYYTYVLEEINKLDYKKSKLSIRMIVGGTQPHLTYAKWFSPNNTVSETTIDDIKKWLIAAKKFVMLFESIANDYNNHIGIINSGKIKPYIINIEHIVEDMLTYRIA